MLQLAHRYYRSVLGFFFITIIGISMLFFGIDYGPSSRNLYAIKVDESEISFQELEQVKQERTAQLFRMLGPNYEQFAAQLLEGLDQRIVDQLIEEALLKNYSQTIGFGTGKEYVPQLIRNLFPSGFNFDEYRGYLQSVGTTAPAFEKRITDQTLLMQMKGVFEHTAAHIPDILLRSLYDAKERQYSVRIVKIPAEFAMTKVEAPSNEQLEEYLSTNAVDYELPARVRGAYALFPAENFRSKVEVSDEEIELYYVDNERLFRTPEKVKIREIALKIDPSDLTAQIGVEGLANELLERIEKGEDFLKLATEYSDEQKKGTPSSWIERGSQGDEFDSTFFGEGVEIGKRSLVKSAGQIRIIELLEKENSKVKPIEEVRNEITEKIREEQSPIYAAEIAREAFDKIQAKATTFDDVIKEHNLKLVEVHELTSLESSSPEFRPIVREALAAPETPLILVDVGQALALARIDEQKEAEIPGFTELKEKLLNDFKRGEAARVASSLAQDLFQQIVEKPFTDEALQELGAVVERLESKKLAELTMPPFSSSEVRLTLSGNVEVGIVGDGPFEVNEEPYILELTKITLPTDEDFLANKDAFTQEGGRRFASLLEEGLISYLKGKASIDINPGALNG